MCPNKKIRRHACSGAASLPIGLPSQACLESGLRLERTELDPQFTERVTAGRNRWKAAGNLGPYHVAGEQGPLPCTGTQRIPGSDPELGIMTQEIKQYAAIDGGNHLRGYSPRSSFMMSSVRRPSFRIPKYLSNGSRGTSLVITKRPRSSLTSRTWPARMPSRSRRGFGMVTCPFSESVVFILVWYEFLPSLSSSSATRYCNSCAASRISSFEFRDSIFNDPMIRWPNDPMAGWPDDPMNRSEVRG